jgi:hypothetical protein
MPGLSLLRVPSRAWLIVALALSVLAGHGAQTLTQAWWPRLVERYARVHVRLPSAATALVVMGVVGALDLARFNGTLLEVRPMPAPSPAAAWLRAQPGQFRVYSPSYSLPAGDGLEHVDGVDPLQLAATVDFVERATGVASAGYSVTLPAFAEGDVATANRLAVPDAMRLGLLNVRYVAAEFPIEAAGLSQVATFDTTRVYENAAWRPRAWIVDEPIGDIVWTPNHIMLTATGPGRLVLSEVNYPGWQARVDGRRVPIVTEHALLRAVDLPAGEHTVEFDFKPISVFAGAGLSLAGVAALAAVLWRERRLPW